MATQNQIPTCPDEENNNCGICVLCLIDLIQAPCERCGENATLNGGYCVLCWELKQNYYCHF